ncbi:MAG: ribonuclease III [Geobacter sp.]|nr:MAG: ribonuclease III [Geobacter sp.]
MNMQDSGRLTGLEAAIDYTFKDRHLLCQALTHRSYLNEAGDRSLLDNERLEFFGDTVLDFFLSAILLERFPESREGELTRVRSSLVDEESLAGIALSLGLGEYLLLGRGEEKSGGREKRSLLADAYEALLAAVYLDGGMRPARRLIRSHFGPLLVGKERPPGGKDHKTEFQELVQARWGKTPHYVVTGSEGPDHERSFTVAAMVGDDVLGIGDGGSKKEAAQAAARNALVRLAGDSFTG